MQNDPKEYLEHANRCAKLAAETIDPVLKEDLLNGAKR
jgi:hypothetical protein